MDCLVIMQKERLLLSGTCDGFIRVWNLDDLSGKRCLLHKFNVFNFDFEREEVAEKLNGLPVKLKDDNKEEDVVIEKRLIE